MCQKSVWIHLSIATLKNWPIRVSDCIHSMKSKAAGQLSNRALVIANQSDWVYSPLIVCGFAAPSILLPPQSPLPPSLPLSLSPSLPLSLSPSPLLPSLPAPSSTPSLPPPAISDGIQYCLCHPLQDNYDYDQRYNHRLSVHRETDAGPVQSPQGSRVSDWPAGGYQGTSCQLSAHPILCHVGYGFDSLLNSRLHSEIGLYRTTRERLATSEHV